MKTQKLIFKTLGLGALLLPSITLAQGLLPPAIPNLPGGSSAGNNTLTYWIPYYINIFLAVVGIIAVAFLIFGGIRYITSAGNEEAAESGKKIITNAIIGLVIVIFSYIIVTVIVNALARQIY